MEVHELTAQHEIRHRVQAVAAQDLSQGGWYVPHAWARQEDLRRGSLCLYSMRKSFSTHLRMCGVDDDMVGRLMRHAGSPLNSRVHTDAGLLDLREPPLSFDERDRMERRVWRRGPLERPGESMRGILVP